MNKVVQYHRRKRLHIAPEPESLTRAFARRGGQHSGQTATELDCCQVGGPQGLAASHSGSGHRGGAQRDGRHQSEPDLGDPPRHSVSGRALDQAAGGIDRALRSAQSALRRPTNYILSFRRKSKRDLPPPGQARSGGSLSEISTLSLSKGRDPYRGVDHLVGKPLRHPLPPENRQHST